MHLSNTIAYLDDGNFRFLGMQINGYLNTSDFKESLKHKVCHLLEKVDQCPASVRYKLRLYQQGIYPRLAWLLCLVPLAPSWVKSDIGSKVTSYLKKWTNFHRSACTARLYLDQSRGGLGMPCLSACSKILQASKSSSFITSKDNCVRFLATAKANQTLKAD